MFIRLTAKILLATGVLLLLTGIVLGIVSENHWKAVPLSLIGIFYIIFAVVNRKSRHPFWDKLLDWSGLLLLLAGIAYLLFNFFTDIETVK
jgi:drug/metabolite transporter (DMT)-like permease